MNQTLVTSSDEEEYAAHGERPIARYRPNTDVNYDPYQEHVVRSKHYEIGERTATRKDIVQNMSRYDQNVTKYYEGDLEGNRFYIPHSATKRRVELISEEGDHFTMTLTTNTRVDQVIQLIAEVFHADENKIKLVNAVGQYPKPLGPREECAATVRVKGIKTFVQPRHEYEHPLMIVGGGYGGMMTAIRLAERGRTDFTLFELLSHYGGGWKNIANDQTKLQTEAGSYAFEFFFPERPFKETNPTWPSKRQLLMLFDRAGADYGIHEFTKFNTKVISIRPKGKLEDGDRRYQVHHAPCDNDANEVGEVELSTMGCAICWPGNLREHKVEVYKGEEDFDGYIVYASMNKADWKRCIGKDCTIIGHGAFAIENVRTLLEHDANKINLLCRRRNICSPKPVSWLVTSLPAPVPGRVLLDCLKDGYDLIGWDPWTCYSVQADAAHHTVRVDQGTMFGVTDVYFVAGYYGIMQVFVGDVKRLDYHKILLKTKKAIDCECILKSVGVRGSAWIDKMLGLKELVGFWVNGDPLFPCQTNTLFVQASNFGGFSIGPGLAPGIHTTLWLIDRPQDWAFVRDILPRHNKNNNPIHNNALYVYSAAFAQQTGIMMGRIPGLGEVLGVMNNLKHTKQNEAHPTEQFLEECMAEWDMYIDMCKAHPNADKSKPEPVYPYTPERMRYWMQKSMDEFAKDQQAKYDKQRKLAENAAQAA